MSIERKEEGKRTGVLSLEIKEWGERAGVLSLERKEGESWCFVNRKKRKERKRTRKVVFLQQVLDTKMSRVLAAVASGGSCLLWRLLG